MQIEKLVRKNVRRLKPYQAKEISCRVKLDANESPYGFSDALKAVRRIETNRYPDPEAKALRAVLARMWRIRAENILHGNGSDELIYYLISTFGGPVIYPTPTFSMYGIMAQVLDAETVEVPLDERFGLRMREMESALKASRGGILFISSPNNPTGNAFEGEEIERLIRTSRGIVVVDEAYQPFSSRGSFVRLVREYPNLVVMKTLSKIGLAALRSGFIVAGREIIGEVNKVRLPFNMNSLSQAVALSALEDRARMNEAVRMIVRERHRLFSGLKEIEGVEPFPSDANFILFRVRDADRVHRMLLKRGVLVRNLSDVVEDCLRVTVGLPGENSIFLKELAAVVRES